MQDNPVYRCPIEIWNVIFALACEPGGRTAAAICGVSRYFYEAIKPHRLNSLAIYGKSRIAAFHRAMEIIPADVPRAKHLYIGLIPDLRVEDTQEVCDTIIDGWFHGREETGSDRDYQKTRGSDLFTFGPYSPEHEDFQGDVVGGIISQHRDTLQTLTYLTVANYINFKVFGCLPNLQDLAIVYLCHKSIFSEPYVDDTAHQRIQFPLLKRLHLSYFEAKFPFDPEDFRNFAPELTHLRISGRECFIRLENLPPRTKVLLQPIMTPGQEKRQLISQIYSGLSKKSSKKRTVMLEPGRREERRYGFFDALKDWLDVSDGGNAFWDSESIVTHDESGGGSFHLIN